jgi:hypothetical protein
VPYKRTLKKSQKMQTFLIALMKKITRDNEAAGSGRAVRVLGGIAIIIEGV